MRQKGELQSYPFLQIRAKEKGTTVELRCLPYDNNFLENPNLEVHLSFLPCGTGSRQTVHSLLISPVSSLLHVQTKGFYPPSRQNRKASRPFPNSENSHFQNEA